MKTVEELLKDCEEMLKELQKLNDELRIENFKLKTKLQYSEDMYEDLIEKILK